MNEKKIKKGLKINSEIKNKLQDSLLAKFCKYKKVDVNEKNINLYGVPKENPKVWYIVRDDNKKKQIISNNISSKRIMLEILKTLSKDELLDLLMKNQGLTDFLKFISQEEIDLNNFDSDKLLEFISNKKKPNSIFKIKDEIRDFDKKVLLNNNNKNTILNYIKT